MADTIFRQKVKELIPHDDDRDRLFNLLRQYQASQDLNRLLFDLRILLNEPNKLELYDFMRPMILMRHQIEYSRKVPPIPGVKLRQIRLQRRAGEGLGFSVRGGYEHGVGIFVTQVTPGSQADRQGLKVGDEVVRVNGFNISEAIHEDVLNLIKSRDEIVLKVTYIGMLPFKEEITDQVKWEYVNQLVEDGRDDEVKRSGPRDIKIFVDSTGYSSIGCTILSESGPAARYPGIYVEKVHPGSIAEEVGLEPGDQIVEVNDTSFRNITWKEAVLALKSSRQLNMVIRKKTGSQLLQRLTSANRRESVISSMTSVPNRSSVDYGAPPLQDRRESISSPTRSIPSPSPENEERRHSVWNHNIKLDELKLLQQDLARKRQIEGQTVVLSSSEFSSRRGSNSVPPNARRESAAMLNARRESSSGNSPRRESSTGISPRRESSTGISPRRESTSMSNARRESGSYLNTLADVHVSTSGHVRGLNETLNDFEWISKVPGHIYELFNLEDLDGRPLKGLIYKKHLDLGVEVEGGIGSPLGGKILVAMVFEGGVAQMSGQMTIGDQLMMINGQSLINVTSQQAELIIQDASQTAREFVEIYYCETTMVNDEDNITYF